MRKILLFVIVCCLGISVSAQYPGFTAVSDVNRFKNDFSSATLMTQSVKSDFVQEKNLSMLAEKITSKGQFWFKKDAKVRMEYKQPFSYLMILNKDKIYIKDGQKESKASAKSNKLFKQVNKIMIDCMQGTTLNNPDFSSRIFENKHSVLVELSPVAKGVKDLFKSINVIVDKKDFSVNSIQMQELSGDNTIIRFVNKELNTPVADALFNIN